MWMRCSVLESLGYTHTTVLESHTHTLSLSLSHTHTTTPGAHRCSGGRGLRRGRHFPIARPPCRLTPPDGSGCSRGGRGGNQGRRPRHPLDPLPDPQAAARGRGGGGRDDDRRWWRRRWPYVALVASEAPAPPLRLLLLLLLLLLLVCPCCGAGGGIGRGVEVHAQGRLRGVRCVGCLGVSLISLSLIYS